MRLSRFAILGVAVTAMVGCSEPSDGPTTPNTPPLAFVRYINAVPDTLNTTVRFIDQVEYSPISFANVPFRGQGQGSYQPTAAGARKFRVFTADAVNFTSILVFAPQAAMDRAHAAGAMRRVFSPPAQPVAGTTWSSADRWTPRATPCAEAREATRSRARRAATRWTAVTGRISCAAAATPTSSSAGPGTTRSTAGPGTT